MSMALPRRLAILAAIMALALVLGVTELSLSLSERSRADDLRLEAVAIAGTLSDYLGRAAPTADSTALAQALTTWAGLHLRATSAAVFRRGRNGGLTLAARTDNLEPGSEPTLRELQQLRDSAAVVVSSEPRPTPAWRVVVGVAGRRPGAVLVLRLSTAQLLEWSRTERERSYTLAAIAAFLLALGITWLTSRWVGAPMTALSQAMAGAHAGARQAPAAPELGSREFRSLARRYNELRTTLAERERESEARAALLALEEQARGLERLALVDEASASFAHEIGTPLNTMSGHFQLLREDLIAQGASHGVHRIELVQAQLDRVAGIVRAWLSRGTWPRPARVPVNLPGMARQMLEFLEPSLAASGVVAQVHGAEPPPFAATDPLLLQQILLNLLKNAIEALPPGGRIIIGAHREHDTAILTITDDGPGMSADVQQQLFNPFATTKGPLGTGLGLTVSRRLARTLDGDLVHQPTPNGTRWQLSLPAAAPNP